MCRHDDDNLINVIGITIKDAPKADISEQVALGGEELTPMEVDVVKNIHSSSAKLQQTVLEREMAKATSSGSEMGKRSWDEILDSTNLKIPKSWRGPSMEDIVANEGMFDTATSSMPIHIERWFDIKHHKFKSYRINRELNDTEQLRLKNEKEWLNDTLIDMLLNW